MPLGHKAGAMSKDEKAKQETEPGFCTTEPHYSL